MIRRLYMQSFCYTFLSHKLYKAGRKPDKRCGLNQ